MWAGIDPPILFDADLFPFPFPFDSDEVIVDPDEAWHAAEGPATAEGPDDPAWLAAVEKGPAAARAPAGGEFKLATVSQRAIGPPIIGLADVD